VTQALWSAHEVTVLPAVTEDSHRDNAVEGAAVLEGHQIRDKDITQSRDTAASHTLNG
jgi:hypothetical protein